MKNLILAVCVLSWPCFAASFTEFYVQSTALDNLNSGSTTSDLATLAVSAGTWVDTTGVFTKAGMNPVANGVAVGDWASVFPDASTTNVFVGRVTAADDTADTITVSLLAKAGTAPALDAVGATSIRVGGAWRGPSTTGANSNDNFFPFGFVANTLTNATGNTTRINFKGTFNVTNTMSHVNNGPIIFSGYGSTPGDGQKATFNGGNSVAGYVVMNPSGASLTFTDFNCLSNGNSGTSTWWSEPGLGGERILYRVSVHDCRGIGIAINLDALAIECETYGCNQGGAGGNTAAFTISNNGKLVRCISHHNLGTIRGFGGSGNVSYDNCISYSNNSSGFDISSSAFIGLRHCDSYNNVGAGFDFTSSLSTAVFMENCNAFKNSLKGIDSTGTGFRNGFINNCWFGSGTQTNITGNFGTNIVNGVSRGILINHTNIYTSDLTPWVDPANGNFTLLSSATNKATGAGSFTLWTTNGLIIAYPDIGAAQAASTNTTAGGSSAKPIIFLQ